MTATAPGTTGAPGQAGEDHSLSGQGTVLLDIGGEIGALVVVAGDELVGAEIEILPTGDTPHADPAGWSSSGGTPHRHGTGEHVHDSHAHDSHVHDGPRLLHVAVHRRPDGTCSAVFPELHEGTYDLHVRPDGPVRLSVAVSGGAVTNAVWPA